ncbi:hypothetical protein [Maricaulis sp.]|uniref:hypothetical protein n=1 Tax=Maricaulis sp. TaxID=1486257 RepID=UPI002B2768F7|nr:hypothetical protein [Maricaulis sp.]
MKLSQPVLAIVLAFGLAPAQASIPAPAEPPANLPDLIGGIEGSRIWYSFSEQVRFSAVGRIDVATETSLPSRRDPTAPVYLDRVGATVRTTASFHGVSNTIRYERMCTHASDAARDPSADPCFWQARMIRLTSSSAIDEVSRAWFDPQKIEAYLAEHNLNADSYRGPGPDLFGHADEILERLDGLVRMDVVDERSCPAVSQAVEATRGLNPISLAMAPSGNQAIVNFSGPPAPPPPPMGLNFIFTFPANDQAGFDGEIELWAGATRQALGLSEILRRGLRDCVSD